MSVWSQGVFDNSMAWSCYGIGEKVALHIPGGPGNTPPPAGWGGKYMLKPLLPLIDEGYRLVTVTRRRNMPQGYTVEDIAADYARMVAEEFGGQVDLIVGGSYGGMIGQYLAADYPDCFRHIVLIVTACQVVDPDGVDQRFARLVADGHLYTAGATIAAGVYANSSFLPLAKVATGLMTMMLSLNTHEYLANDIVVEADTEPSFDSREALPRIETPVLMLSGTDDSYFPEALTRETAALIPDCTLKFYEGKGHIGAAMDERVAEDILAFIAQNDQKQI